MPVYILVPISRSIMQLATSLCNKYWDVRPSPLRSLDAIQLACALAAAADVSEELIFVTADIRLTAFASLEGFSVVHPAFPYP